MFFQKSNQKSSDPFLIWNEIRNNFVRNLKFSFIWEYFEANLTSRTREIGLCRKRSNFFRATRSKFRESKCKFRENPNCARAFKNDIARRLSISRCFNEKNITLFSRKPRLEFDTCATASCIYRFCKLCANDSINFLDKASRKMFWSNIRVFVKILHILRFYFIKWWYVCYIN